MDEQTQVALAERDSIIVQVSAIKTDEDRENAHRLRLAAKEWLDRFKEHESRVCDPQYKAWKNSKAWFAEQRERVEKFLAAVEGVLNDDREKEERRIALEQSKENDAAERRRDRAEAKGKPSFPVGVPRLVQDVGKTVSVDGHKSTWVNNWKARVVDESKLPREYLMPDMKKLDAAAKANISVPGMERWNDRHLR